MISFPQRSSSVEMAQKTPQKESKAVLVSPKHELGKSKGLDSSSCVAITGQSNLVNTDCITRLLKNLL